MSAEIFKGKFDLWFHLFSFWTPFLFCGCFAAVDFSFSPLAFLIWLLLQHCCKLLFIMGLLNSFFF